LRVKREAEEDYDYDDENACSWFLLFPFCVIDLSFNRGYNMPFQYAILEMDLLQPEKNASP